jgi:pre-mRNA-splicing factor SYF1
MVAATPVSLVDRLRSAFPLTNPIPTPLTHPELIHPTSIITEEDLSVNSENIAGWLRYINAVRDRINKSKVDEAEDVSLEGSLLGPLAGPEDRRALQELTMIYERALSIFPTSFKLWKLYIHMRQMYVLGPVTESAIKAKKQNAARGAKTKTDVTECLAFAEAEYQWEGGIDGVIGYEEWKSLIGTGERMIRCLPNVSHSLGILQAVHLIAVHLYL